MKNEKKGYTLSICFQQGARTSRFGAKLSAPQFYKVATTSR